MPRRDGTGPNGLGSRTGWGMGNCPPVDTNRDKAVKTSDEIDSIKEPVAQVPYGYGRRMGGFPLRAGFGNRGFGRGFGRGLRRGGW